MNRESKDCKEELTDYVVAGSEGRYLGKVVVTGQNDIIISPVGKALPTNSLQAGSARPTKNHG